jgi:hypothetical protein
MSDDSRRPLTELVFLRRGLVPLNVVVVVVVAAGIGVAGTLIVRLQEHFASVLARGGSLSGVQALLGRGSVPATAAAGWVAAALFGFALVRLRRGPLEPPTSMRPVEAQSVAQLRRGLRREFTVIRAGLVVVLLVTALDVARLLAMLTAVESGDRRLSGSFPATCVEVCGLMAATLLLALWAKNFRRRLDQLGVL